MNPWLVFGAGLVVGFVVGVLLVLLVDDDVLRHHRTLWKSP